MFATTPGQSDSFSIFMDSFVLEFGWSRTYISSLFSAATLLSGCLMFFVGRIVDKNWGQVGRYTLRRHFRDGLCFAQFCHFPAYVIYGLFSGPICWQRGLRRFC